MSGDTLRHGFTTGTAAAAAAKAATLLIATGTAEGSVDTPLPPGGRYRVPLAWVRDEGPDAARAAVVKDGGDDPDATHGARIEVLVRLSPAAAPKAPCVTLRGGRGVGLVTRPGLPVAPGEPAINPAPRAQIEAAVREALALSDTPRDAVVTIEVPDGEAIATRTLNPRLGIQGGISILGTRGTVVPYSHDAWRATILQGFSVARAAGLDEVVLTTGGRSERLHRALFPETPELAYVQAADFFAFSCREAGRAGFARITWAVFFGKLVKQARGLGHTHAHSTPQQLDFLAAQARAAGVAPAVAEAGATANTALHALELLSADPALPRLLAGLCAMASACAEEFADQKISVAHRLLAFDGRLLTSTKHTSRQPP